MTRIVIASLFAAVFTFPALADQSKKDAAAQGATQSSAMVDGEVRKVDKDAKKITLRHGPMPALDMPAMTMVFQVKDPAMLEQVKAGDKVKFQAEKVGGAFTITKLESAN
jgi:Cu(I)/Ag(I) efflux system protein CusF